MRKRQTVGSTRAPFGWLAISVTALFAVPSPPAAAQEPLLRPATQVAPAAEQTPTWSARFTRGSTRWLGWYVCRQGQTRLELTLNRDSQTNDLTGVFAFSAHPRNPGVPSGRFTLAGRYDPAHGGVTLRPKAWLEQPSGYGMIGLSGTMDAEQRTFVGDILVEDGSGSPCKTFALVRAEPGAPWPVEPEPAPAAAPSPLVESGDKVVARVDGREIRVADVGRHAETFADDRAAALKDLIDLQLLETALRQRGLPTPPAPWTPENRAAVTDRLADALGIHSLSHLDDLQVDHAFVRDRPNRKAQEEQRGQFEELRRLVAAGRGLMEAWRSLGLDGDLWHVAEGEEYPAPVVPEGARHLKAGDLSPILPGDGGLHLFKVHGRRPQPQALEVRRNAVLFQLRAAATIEKLYEAE